MSVGVVIGRFQDQDSVHTRTTFKDELVEVYRDGKLLINWTFDEIRGRTSVYV